MNRSTNNLDAFSGVEMGEENSYGTRLQVFVSMVIIGYFGVKIIYATFFGFYPQKYYNETVVKAGSEGEVVTSKWNNELYDFVTVMILSFIVFLFANVASKRMITGSTSLSPSFLVGYLVGLGYPASKKIISELEDQNEIGLKYLTGFFYMVVALFAIASNFMTNGGNLDASHVNYIIYLVVIALIIYGLYYSRPGKKIRMLKREPEGTNTMASAFENAQVNLNIPFISFIILLLFQRDPSAEAFRLVVYFLFGMLLGIMVSGVSFYGIQYMIDGTTDPSTKAYPQPAISNTGNTGEVISAFESRGSSASFQGINQVISGAKKDIMGITGEIKKATGEDAEGILKKIKTDTESFFSLKNLKRALVFILVVLIIILLFITVGTRLYERFTGSRI
jgi:hypothetical protein